MLHDYMCYSSWVCLEEHADDGHHGEAAVGKLGRQLLGFLSRVGGGQHLEAEVARGSRGAGRLVLGNFAEGHVSKDLSPSGCWHLGDGSKAVGHIGEFQSCGWRQISRELSSDLWSNVTHGSKHRDTTMLQLRLAAALEVLDAAVGRESCRIPETDRILNAQLILECSQRRSGVVGPISPSAASEAVLSTERFNHYKTKKSHRTHMLLMGKLMLCNRGCTKMT